MGIVVRHIVWERRELFYFPFFYFSHFFSLDLSNLYLLHFRSCDVLLVLALVFFSFSHVYMSFLICFFRCIFHISRHALDRKTQEEREAWLGEAQSVGET